MHLSSTKVSVYELIRPQIGTNRQPYRAICLHKSAGFDFVKKELSLRVLIPHYELEFFERREFVIEFDDRMFIRFTGSEVTGEGKPRPKSPRKGA